MSQDKATVHPLFAVPSSQEDSLTEEDFERDFDEALDEPEVCPLCYGSGMEVVPDKGARVCECRKNKKKESLLETLRVPKRYAACQFTNYKPRHISQTKAATFAFNFANKYPAVNQGLLLMGPVGVGKTHLAVSIIKSLTEKGIPCLFSDFGSLIKEIQGTYNRDSHTTETSVLTPIIETDVLIMDEVGATKPTDWVRDTLGYIINERYNEKKHTILTTNYLDEEFLHDSRSLQKQTLEERIGIRLRSRLYEMCRTVYVEGKDYRKTINSPHS